MEAFNNGRRKKEGERKITERGECREDWKGGFELREGR